MSAYTKQAVDYPDLNVLAEIETYDKTGRIKSIHIIGDDGVSVYRGTFFETNGVLGMDPINRDATVEKMAEELSAKQETLTRNINHNPYIYYRRLEPSTDRIKALYWEWFEDVAAGLEGTWRVDMSSGGAYYYLIRDEGLTFTVDVDSYNGKMTLVTDLPHRQPDYPAKYDQRPKIGMSFKDPAKAVADINRRLLLDAEAAYVAAKQYWADVDRRLSVVEKRFIEMDEKLTALDPMEKKITTDFNRNNTGYAYRFGIAGDAGIWIELRLSRRSGTVKVEEVKIKQQADFLTIAALFGTFADFGDPVIEE